MWYNMPIDIWHLYEFIGQKEQKKMKFVEQDKNIYMPIYGEVAVLDELPAKVYTIKSNPMQGLYLEVYCDRFDINEEKLYGDAPKKIDKIIRTYNLSNRNTGVIMSGEKGLGKTLCSKMLCNKMIDMYYPVILCDKPFGGVADFLHKIEQKCVVLFDEFEKHFNLRDRDGDDNDKPQEQFLSLFDGIDTGKKLFIVTCNNTYKLNDFFLNRPGRFHYHIEFKYPTSEEIKEYMEDNCVDTDEIESIIAFAKFCPLNFDSLRAIAFEIHNGYTFREAILDLNIIMTYGNEYRISVKDEIGNSDWCTINLLKLMTRNTDMMFNFSIHGTNFQVSFNTNDVTYVDGSYYVDLKKAKIFNAERLKSPISEIKIYNDRICNPDTLHFTL